MIRLLTRKIWNRYRVFRQKIWWFAFRNKFGQVGKNVQIIYPGSFSFNNIYIGNDVYIGEQARLWASESKIFIADKVVIGPQLTIMGGDHNIHKVGTYIIDTSIKDSENDKDVRIETDVWIGCNVIILKGVIVGRGAAIGAGSIVTKNVPPYALVAGNPARVIKYRFSAEEISEHEKQLNLEK